MEEVDAGALDGVGGVEEKGSRSSREEDGDSDDDDDDDEGDGDAGGEDPIMDLVDLLRQQRMMMVQGEMQFGYLYEVTAELWMRRWKARNNAASV
jgi:hypothetical protein